MSSRIVGDFGTDALDVDRDIFAGIGQRHHRVDRRVAGDDDADRLQTLAAGHRRHQNAQLLAFLDAAVAAAQPEHLNDRGDLVGRGALIAQDGGDGVAFLDHEHVLVERIAAGRLIRWSSAAA